MWLYHLQLSFTYTHRAFCAIVMWPLSHPHLFLCLGHWVTLDSPEFFPLVCYKYSPRTLEICLLPKRSSLLFYKSYKWRLISDLSNAKYLKFQNNPALHTDWNICLHEEADVHWESDWISLSVIKYPVQQSWSLSFGRDFRILLKTCIRTFYVVLA